MARRTKDEAQKTREAILNAAEKIFFAQGVTRSSLEEIAHQANVTRGAVYWHFKDKSALCDAMAQRIFLPHEDMLKELAAQSSQTPIEDLKNACIHAITMVIKDKRRRNVLTILSSRCEYVDEMEGVIKRSNASKSRMLALSENLFSRAKELKMLAPGWAPRQAAVAMQALIMGLILNSLEDRKNFSLSSVGIPCVEAFFNSLQSE